MVEPLTVQKLLEARLAIVYRGRTGGGEKTTLTYCIEYPDIGHYLVTKDGEEIEASYTFGGSREHFREKDLERFVAEYNAWHTARDRSAA